MAGKFYWFSYPTAPRSRRHADYLSGLDIHRMRDGCMMLALSGPLHDEDYRYGGEILNFQSFIPKPDTVQCLPVLGADDVVVLPTRPPLSEDKTDNRRIDPSGTALEAGVFKASSYFFHKLDRSRMVLTAELRRSLGHGDNVAHYGHIIFEVNGGAGIRKFVGSDILPGAAETLGCLMVVPNAFGCGARLLGAFAMGGQQTLIWAKALLSDRERVREFLRSTAPRFLLMSFSTPQTVPYPFVNYPDLQYTLIADVTLE